MATSAPAFTFNGVNTVLAQYTTARDDIARVMFLHHERLHTIIAHKTLDIMHKFNEVYTHGKRLDDAKRAARTDVLLALTCFDQLPTDYNFNPDEVTKEGLTTLLASDDLKVKFVVWIGTMPASHGFFKKLAKDLNSESETLVAGLIDSGVQLNNDRQRENAEVVTQLCTDHHVVQPVDDATQSPPVGGAVSQASGQDDVVQANASVRHSFVPLQPSGSNHTDMSQSMHDHRPVTVNTSKCGSCCSSKPKEPMPFHTESPKKTGWFGWW